MAFARHNIEKHRLIEMVRMNPILWDCRLPHYKRSDKKKDIKWNELGRAFAVSGERVQRTFTSLREIFRRELNHEKMLGNRFKSKWEYYGAMGFLKNVIRERKTRDRVKSECFHRNIDISFQNNIDEYQYFPAREPKFPHQHHQSPPQPPTIPSTANVIHLSDQRTAVSHQDLPTHLMIDQQKRKDEIDNVTLRSTSTSSSIYIKEEPQDANEVFTSPPPPVTSSQQTDKVTSASDAVSLRDSENISTKDASSVTPKKTDSSVTMSSQQSHLKGHPNAKATTTTFGGSNRRVNSLDFDYVDDVDDDDDDDDDGDEDDVDDNDDPNEFDAPMLPATSRSNTAPIKESAREDLYMKFGEFLAARLNTLSETVANELMNKILLLVAEK